jgi:hypothetical protein
VLSIGVTRERDSPIGDSVLRALRCEQYVLALPHVRWRSHTRPLGGQEFAKRDHHHFFYEYRHDTIMGALQGAKDYIAAHPIDKAEFKLAIGLFGILAAINSLPVTAIGIGIDYG